MERKDKYVVYIKMCNLSNCYILLKEKCFLISGKQSLKANIILDTAHKIYKHIFQFTQSCVIILDLVLLTFYKVII